MDDIGYIVTGWVVGCGLLSIAWMVSLLYDRPIDQYPQDPPSPPVPDFVPPDWSSDATRRAH